ncbi:hypothetical protein LCGC14_0232390 [marine sediment metagenome]|uniref:Uncharacterized protein n=1 Tax=marine sediment metagenome TaxID=412755 RepID=A0A0F9XEC2_9ZZZZ
MTNTIVEVPTPHSLFETLSPNMVAECIPGVQGDLYRLLWALVHKHKREARPGAPDCLARFWKQIPRESQWELNSLARKHELYLADLLLLVQE